jgi:hypothetical protein
MSVEMDLLAHPEAVPTIDQYGKPAFRLVFEYYRQDVGSDFQLAMPAFLRHFVAA